VSIGLSDLAVSGLDAGLEAELAQTHRHADDYTAQQQVEDAGHVRQLQRTGCLLLSRINAVDTTIYFSLVVTRQKCSQHALSTTHACRSIPHTHIIDVKKTFQKKKIKNVKNVKKRDKIFF